MGRRFSVGVVSSGGSVGLLSVDANTLSSVDTNTNLTLSPNGTGEIRATSNLQLNAQADLRLADSDSTHYVALHSPATVSASYTMTMPNAVSTRVDNALLSDTSGNLTWAPVKYTYSTQNTSFSASTWNAYFVITSGGGVTVTLPSSPVMGDTIRLIDVAGTFNSNAMTVARNGKVIMGDSADLTVSSRNAAFDLVFSNDTYGWRIFSI